MHEDSRSPEFPKVRKKREREANSVRNIKYFFVIRLFFIFVLYIFIVNTFGKEILILRVYFGLFFQTKIGYFRKRLVRENFEAFSDFRDPFVISFCLSLIVPLDVKNCFTK